MNKYLMHYGIKGQKWGVRRFQNDDGSLTAAGRERYGEDGEISNKEKRALQKEARKDSKEAYELGKAATYYGRAVASSANTTSKLQNKIQSKNEKGEAVASTSKLYKKYEAAVKAQERIVEDYEKIRTKAEAHCQQLTEKYGDTAVNQIKYSDISLSKASVKASNGSKTSVNVVNERTVNGKDIAISIATTVAGTVLMSALSPVGKMAFISTPQTSEQVGSSIANEYYKQEYKSNK